MTDKTQFRPHRRAVMAGVASAAALAATGVRAQGAPVSLNIIDVAGNLH